LFLNEKSRYFLDGDLLIEMIAVHPTLKLTNLPFGITAFDLREIYEKTNAKICFIPRTRDKYSRLRFAFISFANDEDMAKAAGGENQFTIKGQKLYWVDSTAKTCHKCGSPDHEVKNCKEKEESYQRKQRLAQFSKVYNRYRVPNYRKYNRYANQQQARNYQQ